MFLGILFHKTIIIIHSNPSHLNSSLKNLLQKAALNHAQ